MRSLDFRRYALGSCAFAAMLAGCGGSPISFWGAMQQTSAIATHAERGKSWMLPGAKSEGLLYVATGDNVYVLSYPHGKLVGSLGIAGNNLCSDNQGDVFIPAANGYDQIFEYAHGRDNPIQKLDDGDIPLGCAVDPTTGNLAVTNEGSGAGEVAIFPNAKEPSTWYRDPEIGAYGLCGYDDKGDLFVDGSGSGNFLAELPDDKSTFRNYSLNRSFDVYGSVQWDGEHITLSNPTSEQIYRLKLSRSSLKVVQTTQIDGWQNNYSGHWPYVQTWVQGASFIAQSSTQAELGLWSYPKGGNANKVIGPFRNGSVNIYGVTVSLAQKGLRRF